MTFSTQNFCFMGKYFYTIEIPKQHHKLVADWCDLSRQGALANQRSVRVCDRRRAHIPIPRSADSPNNNNKDGGDRRRLLRKILPSIRRFSSQHKKMATSRRCAARHKHSFRFREPGLYRPRRPDGKAGEGSHGRDRVGPITAHVHLRRVWRNESRAQHGK